MKPRNDDNKQAAGKSGSNDLLDFGFRINCDHKCHRVGLNEWVEVCPICGCSNPNYKPDAKPDIEI